MADTMNPANSIPPNRNCSETSSFAIKANTSDTKNAKRTSRRKWLCTLLAAERDVVRVDDNEKIQQTGDDEECVPIFVANGAHIARAQSECACDEVRNTNADVRQCRKRDEWLGEIKWKETPVDGKTDGEH